MKFLFISPRYSGGIGGHAYMLSEQLKNAGHSVDLFPTSHIPIKTLKNPSFALFGSLRALTHKQEYDIVHAFNVPSAFAMKLVRAKKKILSIHGTFSDAIKLIHSKPLGTVGSFMERRAVMYADKITTDSLYTKKIYKEAFGYDLEYLPSPIDTGKFKTIPNVEKINDQVVYVGRADYGKGIDLLQKAENLIRGKVVYCTNLPWLDAMKILSASSVLVQPSRMESLATSIKEAFFLRVPVVASNVGGNPELVKNNITGILVPPEDPKSIADAVNLLLEDKGLSKKLSDNAYEFVNQNMTWEAVLPKYIQFYENLLTR